ncbi:M56 family metallopeptidase [Alteraurantiacibacter palmitatis]|uniref:M56 family metallopeptidase n=1 Tax=Alteraurantiacibacter palmitatis TaxID=2054628 RepID=A0ABV7E748_9SPHN
MIGWLVDSFVWTGALIAAVLLLRRPVARHFGPQVAYALWALPLLRLFLPPVILPASMAPSPEVARGGTQGFGLLGEPASQGSAWLLGAVLALWLGGALLFLALRLRDYRAMRRTVLRDARPMGEAGDVRLVETPAVSSPVAFGLRDKVVALPPGFMAQADLAARDMAIEHELAHHRGRDLWANAAAQLLLGFHWFNPLAWAGWYAMRSDQEAACDARVLAGRGRADRASYGQLIAECAAGGRLGQRLTMVAAIACPVLGEKSIIHRLRSLTRGEVSSRRHRLGLAVIGGAALLALPLTASLRYASPPPSAALERADRAGVGAPAVVAVAEVDEPQSPAPPRIERPDVASRSPDWPALPRDALAASPSQADDTAIFPLSDGERAHVHLVGWHEEAAYSLAGELVMVRASILIVAVPHDAAAHAFGEAPLSVAEAASLGAAVAHESVKAEPATPAEVPRTI